MRCCQLFEPGNGAQGSRKAAAHNATVDTIPSGIDPKPLSPTGKPETFSSPYAPACPRPTRVTPHTPRRDQGPGVPARLPKNACERAILFLKALEKRLPGWSRSVCALDSKARTLARCAERTPRKSGVGTVGGPTETKGIRTSVFSFFKSLIDPGLGAKGERTAWAPTTYPS